MQFEGTTYRPPVEADTMLLQVTVGCAHNRCTYCNMYDDVIFRIITPDQIEQDLIEARQNFPEAKRIFLVNGDAFVLSANRQKKITQQIAEYFPECKTITMYASIQNIISKSDDDLKELKKWLLKFMVLMVLIIQMKLLQRLSVSKLILNCQNWVYAW